MSVDRVRKGALSPSIECGQPRIGQKNSEFMMVKKCRGLVSWFRFHKPLGDHWEEGSGGSFWGGFDDFCEFSFS
jgi:hypothetical protein